MAMLGRVLLVNLPLALHRDQRRLRRRADAAGRNRWALPRDRRGQRATRGSASSPPRCTASARPAVTRARRPAPRSPVERPRRRPAARSRCRSSSPSSPRSSAAFAAFCVWLELLMRDAAVYVVALFAPLALAASIWPRWSGALRRSGELLAVVIGSKFVIVSIIALAAGLVSERAGGVEHILAAAALMVLACFCAFRPLSPRPLRRGGDGGGLRQAPCRRRRERCGAQRRLDGADRAPRGAGELGSGLGRDRLAAWSGRRVAGTCGCLRRSVGHGRGSRRCRRGSRCGRSRWRCRGRLPTCSSGAGSPGGGGAPRAQRRRPRCPRTGGFGGNPDIGGGPGRSAGQARRRQDAEPGRQRA